MKLSSHKEQKEQIIQKQKQPHWKAFANPRIKELPISIAPEAGCFCVNSHGIASGVRNRKCPNSNGPCAYPFDASRLPNSSPSAQVYSKLLKHIIRILS